MRVRSWVTLAIRLVGLAAVLMGIYDVISIIEVSSSPQMASLAAMAKDSPIAGMFTAETLRPSYLAPSLWIGVGLLLMVISAPLCRLLFSGLEAQPPVSSSEAPPTA